MFKKVNMLFVIPIIMTTISYEMVYSMTQKKSCVSKVIEKSIVIVSSSRNNKKNYEKNLESLLNQNYKNYKIIWIDDASDDGTPELVEEYLKKNDSEKKVILVKNQERLWVMENFYRTIHACSDEDIIVIVDGDDWLAHENVLQVVNRAYAEDIWLTYGNNKPNKPWKYHFAYEIPQDVIEKNDIRNKTFTTAHLRTFYAWLFKKIKLEDLMYKGNFVRVHCDLASMVPMVEMAGMHTKFISEVLYVYNNDSEYNNFNNPGYHKNHVEYKAHFLALPKYLPLEKKPSLSV